MTDVIEHLVEAPTCVVSFASGGGSFSEGVPHFEFGRTLEALGVAYALMRDSTDFSGQFGITGIGDRAAVCSYLETLKGRYKRVVAIGLSVGAMQALMYGQLARLHEVIVLSPFSALGQDADAVFGPDWRTRCPFPTDVELLIDLQSIFVDGPIPKTVAFISDGDGTENDLYMATRIGITDIRMVPGASHAGLGKLMRNAGMLDSIIGGTK